MMLREVSSAILKHTIISRSHLTPEIALRLITPASSLWTAKEEEVPFQDPFWAFYWPGGQATARYILDNGHVVKDKNVLDIGCGCGAGAIAAAKMAAKRVVANDIDTYAITATQINAKLNDVALETNESNLIETGCTDFDTLLIGDMFYNEEFASVLFKWLLKLRSNGKMILIGDPGRHGLTEQRRQHITLLAKYKLPPSSCVENHGFTETSLWCIK